MKKENQLKRDSLRMKFLRYKMSSNTLCIIRDLATFIMLLFVYLIFLLRPVLHKITDRCNNN